MSTGSPLPPIAGESPSGGRIFDAPESNPFKLPADDQIFRLREDDKKKRHDEREKNKNLKIWEKKKKNVVKSHATRMYDLLGEEGPRKLGDTKEKEEKNQKSSVRRQEKENMAEFIAKKREMFLVQMSLDTKREEIRKLEEKAQMKEEALQRSEQMLEEDAMRFDAFLKENDKKAHDAIKKAEEETKRKQEKAQEIKRLTQQIQALSSEMSKHKEALEDCLRYKQFLDMLTPPEFFEQQKRLREEKIEEARVQIFEEKRREWEETKKAMVDQYKRELEQSRKEDKRGKNKRREKEEVNVDEIDSPRLHLPPPPKLEDIPSPELDLGPYPMYFKEPQQLMDIFAALEEQNLFLIQNSQETEHTLEELRLAFKDTKQTMGSQTDSLQSQIDDLQREIQQEEKRAKDLLAKRTHAAAHAAVAGSDKSAGSAPPSQQEKEKLLSDLHSKVRYVYEQCGFDASSKPSTLFMLSQLESKLELLLSEIEKMPVEYVIKAEKDKEKKRREHKREEQQALQEKLQEERNKRSIERSLQAPKKRVGRQVMFRSKPIRKEKISLGDDSNKKDNNDELKFLS